MSNRETASGRDRLSSQNKSIEQACAQFQAAAQAGRRLEIEEFVGQFPQVNRELLVGTLTALQAESQGTKDETLTFDARLKQPLLESNHERFPEKAPHLNALQQKWEQSPDVSLGVELSAIVDPPAHLVAVHPSAHAPGRRIKQFELLTFLGQGGFGVVWRAHDETLQRDVAIKFPRPDRLLGFNKGLFLEEARLAAKLRHPNIVTVYEVGEFHDEIYIVSELVDGITLKAWAQNRALSSTDAARVIAKLATAVQHAHEQGIVHRDLKPANVLIDAQGEPHITDFGMAQRDEMSGAQPAFPGLLLGTPAYMAPEQARGDQQAIDVRTDVYALGANFYELLTAERPFHGDTDVLVQKVQFTIPKAPRLIKPGIPQELEAICLKCLAKEQDDRYPTAQALADDLRRFMAGDAIPGIPAAMPRRVQKWFHRHRRFMLAISLTFFVALTVAGSLAWQFRGTKPIPPDVRPVEISTEPPGSEITAIALDHKTGEPDPGKIYNSQGQTPVKMLLPPGDYLIVAVLDQTRFNEVHRHVPADDEMTAYGHRAFNFRRKPGGLITVPTIPIPTAERFPEMALIDSTERLVEPLKENQRVWRMPAFWVDRREVTAQALLEFRMKKYGAGWEAAKKRYTGLDPGPGPEPKILGIDWIAELESQGKRMPSAAELYYLSRVVCPSPSNPGDKELVDSCVLKDGSTIDGLHSGLLEWTSTKTGGPFTGYSPLNPNDKWFGLLRAVGGGSPVPGRTSHTGFQSIPLPSSKNITVRGVRSTHPRRRPEDFATQVKSQEL